MIDDLIASPQYWGVFFLSMFVFLLVKYKALDFKFFIILPIAQRIAHLSMLPMTYVSSLMFAVLTAALLIMGYRYVSSLSAPERQTSSRQPSTIPIDDLEVRAYILLASLFLAGYFLIRFALYPQFLYQLDLGDRLQAQYDHRFLFVLSLASPPALTAITVRWVVNDRLTGWDKLLATIIFIGLLSSGSKLSVAPLFLTYFGVAIYVGKQGMFGRAIRVILPMAIFLSLALVFLFPTMSGAEILDMMVYRVVANTEELEFLYYLGFQPDQYPYAGIGALVAPLAKLLGENIAYSPGVWLFGQRYNDWTGFGPNSGFVIELFGNLGYYGLAVPLFIGGLVAHCERKLTIYRVVLLSLLPIAFTESLIFFLALGGQIVLMLLAKGVAFLVARTVRAPTLAIRNARLDPPAV